MTLCEHLPGTGRFTLDARLPDDFGEMYVPFVGETFQDDFGGLRGGWFEWPEWLPARRYFYYGAAVPF